MEPPNHFRDHAPVGLGRDQATLEEEVPDPNPVLLTALLFESRINQMLFGQPSLEEELCVERVQAHDLARRHCGSDSIDSSRIEKLALEDEFLDLLPGSKAPLDGLGLLRRQEPVLERDPEEELVFDAGAWGGVHEWCSLGRAGSARQRGGRVSQLTCPETTQKLAP